MVYGWGSLANGLLPCFKRENIVQLLENLYDNPDANAMANRVSTDIYTMLDDKKPRMSDAFLPASIMFRSVAAFGKLVVRVGGYSDYFNNLTDDMKRMFIARSIHQ